MVHKKKNVVSALIACVVVMLSIPSAIALELNESNLWYGDGEGIEVVFRTGENLAFTDDDPRVDPRMTEFARGMDQAMLKIGDNAYLAYGWDITSPMMVVGDDGVIIIDPPMALEAGVEILAAFRRVTDKPVKAIVYTHNHIDHVAAVKAFTTEEDVASGKVDIYAHETLMRGVINWASTVGPIEGRRRCSATAPARGPSWGEAWTPHP